MLSRILGAVGKYQQSRPYLGFVPYHNLSYTRILGKMAVLTCWRGRLSAWYFPAPIILMLAEYEGSQEEATLNQAPSVE